MLFKGISKPPAIFAGGFSCVIRECVVYNQKILRICQKMTIKKIVKISVIYSVRYVLGDGKAP